MSELSLAFREQVVPTLKLDIGDKSYTVEFPLPAVAMAEKKLGRSLRSPGAWFSAGADDIPALLAAGLSRHHPEVTEADIRAMCDPFGPEAVGEIAAALGALAFPRWTAKYEETVAELRRKGKEAEVSKE